MSDKSTASLPATYALPDIAVVTLTGTDAARFAQAQFMNDVAALACGRWHWNGWLNPKGRVLALFALLKCAEDDIRLLLLDADPAEFCAALARFVFRSKVKLDAPPSVHVGGRFALPQTARRNALAECGDGALELDFSADGGARTLRIASHPDADDTAALARWRGFDLVHGLPRLAPGQSAQWTPQQLSLDRLNAYSVKKGCYPGQEIVARTHFLGQTRRGLVRLVAPAPVRADARVQVDSAAPAPLVAVANCEALAVLALDTPASAQIRIDGETAQRRELSAGLAR